MESINRKPRGLLYALGLAVVLICAATAVACGVFLFIGGMSCASAASASAEFTAVGAMYDRVSQARGRASAERAQGRAGYVLAADDGFMLVYAVYADETDAAVVAERLDCAAVTLCAESVSFPSEDGEECAEALNVIAEVVTETEKIWRQLDEETTSESLSVTQLKSYADALRPYKDAGDGVGGLADEICGMLLTTAAGSEYPLTADIKYLSAYTAARLAEFTAAAAAV